MRGLVHHVDLSVADPWASKPLYDAVLGFLGYKLASEHPRGLDYDLQRVGAFTSLGIMKAEGENAARAHDRYSPGLHHIAWTAESRADVDALHDLLMSIDATVLDPPADYPRYGEGYYAVFFADPDGLKLEFVHKP